MTRKVAILLFDEVEVLDFAGPFEVFAVAGSGEHQYFEVYTVAEHAGAIHARNNLIVTPHYALADCPPPDIFLIPGGQGSRVAMHNPAILDWVKQQHARTELTLSVCTGAFVLAQAGLLDGLQVTTHHGSYDRLVELAPTATVQRGVRYVDNGKVILSAGVQAGMDMALYVVARLCGEAVARATAQHIEYNWQPEH